MCDGISGSFGEAPSTLEQARQLFNRAERFFKAGAYRRAIILYERVRHMPDVPRPEALLFNIGLANMKLRRFATAIIYFENFLASPRISESDRKRAQQRLNEARRGIGIPAAA